MDDDLYNISCTCTDDNFTRLPKCNSSFQTLPTINCNFTIEKCAITSGENKDCSCNHKLSNITTLVHSTLECCYCPQYEGTDAMLGCNLHFTNKSTTTTTISNKQSQNDHGTTVATTTAHNVAIATHNAANTVPTVTISSSILPIITTTPVTSSDSILVPVVAGVLLPVCLLCTISVAASYYLVYHTALPKTSNTSTVRNNTVCTVCTTIILVYYTITLQYSTDHREQHIHYCSKIHSS